MEQNPQNPHYQQPQYFAPQEDTRVMSVGDWLLTMIIMAIPLVNIIMVFVWAFGSGNKNRSNWAKAYLIIMLIAIVLWTFVLVLLISMGVALDDMGVFDNVLL